MTRRTKHLALGLTSAVAIFALAACSSGGGKEPADPDDNTGKANTPEMTFAMVTHAPAGDTFFDIIRKGADAAASKDNVKYEYSSDGDATKQSLLIQAAVDKGVDGLAVSVPNAAAAKGALEKATAAGIPIMMFNSGANDWQDLGALSYFGQDESLAGEAAGKRLVDEGSKNTLCVIQAQGQSQLEARCDGVIKGMSGGKVERLYVEGTDMPSVQSTIAAKLTQDKTIDHVLTLGAPFALAAIKSIADSGSTAELATFDTNAELVGALRDGKVKWAVDQQPYLQGYESIDALWLYKTNGNVLGGGQVTLTGPSFIDETNVEEVAAYAEAGTR